MSGPTGRRFVIPWRKAHRQFGKHLFAFGVEAVVKELGFEVEFPDYREVDRSRYDEDDVFFFLCCVTAGEAKRPSRESGAFRIYYNMEPVYCRPHHIRRSVGHTDRVRTHEVDWIFDYNGHSTEHWREEGFQASYCGLAYHESYEKPEWDAGQLYPEGIYYLGREHSRRGTIVKALRDTFKLPCRALYLRGKNGECEKLHRSPGIHMNLHRTNKPFFFGGIRVVIMGMANGRFVASEECDWVPEGLTSGTHWAMAEGGSRAFYDMVRHYWDRPEERARIAQAGYEFVKEHHRLDVELPRALREAGVI